MPIKIFSRLLHLHQFLRISFVKLILTQKRLRQVFRASCGNPQFRAGPFGSQNHENRHTFRIRFGLLQTVFPITEFLCIVTKLMSHTTTDWAVRRRTSLLWQLLCDFEKNSSKPIWISHRSSNRALNLDQVSHKRPLFAILASRPSARISSKDFASARKTKRYSMYRGMTSDIRPKVYPANDWSSRRVQGPVWRSAGMMPAWMAWIIVFAPYSSRKRPRYKQQYGKQLDRG